MKLFRNPSPKELQKLINKYWTQDSTVLHYTGHMLGIGCRLSSQNAIDKICKLKQRTEKNGFIILLSDLQWLYDHQIEVPSAIEMILSQYWPGNLTVIFTVRNEGFESVSVNGKVAFRVPFDNLLRHIIDYVEEPIISTSVNVSGVPSAVSLDEIEKRYLNWFDLGFLPQKTGTAEPSTIIEYIDNDENGKPVLPYLKCLRESSIPFYEIKQSFFTPTVLFVCMGNICRSPIAEYLFNHYSKGHNLPFVAKSAGLLETGAMISLNSMQLLAEQGIMAQKHSSRQINRQILSGSWLILTMEEKQRDYIKSNYPESVHKVFALKEYIGESGDIADPMGNDLDYYRDIYSQIDDAIRKLFKILEKQK